MSEPVISAGTSLVDYLASKGIRTFKAAGVEVTAACWWCNEGKPNKRKLYLNTETWQYSCLTAETRVVTRAGTFEIGDLAGRDVELLTPLGWQIAPVHAFGTQQTYRITMVRDQAVKTVRATAEHRWFLRSGNQVTTADLREGDRLAAVVAPGYRGPADRVGIVHGVMMGDGSEQPRKSDGMAASHITLWGSKRQLARHFRPTSTTVVNGPNGALTMSASGRSATTPPLTRNPWAPVDLDRSDAYLLGWLQGYFATDGTAKGTSTPHIDGARLDVLERVREVATRLGIVTGPIKSYWRKGIDGQWGWLHRVSLHTSSLWPEFFLRDDQRADFMRFKRTGAPRLSWRVTSIEPDAVEQVFCAVVPGPEAFALEDNLLTGNCKVCDEHGGRKSLLTFFGDEERDELRWAPGTDPMLRSKVLLEAVSLGQDMLYSNPKVLEYLVGRGLTPQTIVDARIGYAPTSWGLGRMLCQSNHRLDVMHAGLLTKEGQEFFSGHILIPYFSHGSVVQLRGKIFVPDRVVGKYVTPMGDNARLYGSDELHGAKRAIVVEGEFDRLAVRQALLASGDPDLMAIAVVGLAGVQTLPQGFERMFDDCARVYLGFDPDDAGDLGVERVKSLLGSKVRVLKLPRELPKCDWSDYFGIKTEKNLHGDHGWQDLAGLIADADAEGRRLFTIRDAQRKLAINEANGGGIPLGFYDLDKYIDPGIKPGQLMVPLARTGVGKSSFIASVAYNARARNQLVCSLELTAAEFYDRLRRVAWFWNPLATDADIARIYENLRIYDQPLGPGDLTRLCDEYVEETGVAPELVHIDYLGYASKRFRGSSQYERTTDTVISIKEEAKACGVAVIAPHQAGRAAAGGAPVRAEDARDSGAIEDTADILPSLYRPSDADRNIEDSTVACGVLKNRNGRINVQTHFVFSMASLLLVPKGTPAASVAEDENRLIRSGDTAAKVRAYRRTNALQRGLHQPWLQ